MGDGRRLVRPAYDVNHVSQTSENAQMSSVSSRILVRLFPLPDG
jgi:hypothetical protein